MADIDTEPVAESMLDQLDDSRPTDDQNVADLETRKSLLAEIKRQIEHYFSDENLASDGFLLKQLGGAENKPVPLKIIMSFRKMRDYRFVDAIEAIRGSEVVDLVNNDEALHRCVALTEEMSAAGKKAAKAKRKAHFASKQGPSLSKQKRVTGFEEWYADGPVTPKQYAEEREIYSPETALSLRLSAAVHRYGLVRRLQNNQMNIFTSWLRYGGWEMGSRRFSGKDISVLDDRDPLDQAVLLSTISVDADMDDPAEWIVNFEKVTTGYFSSYFIEATRQTSETAKAAAGVLNNFFNYLLHHDVCVEYNNQIYDTQKLLKEVERELPNIVQVRGKLPDNFSISMSLLTGGMYSSIFGHDLEFLADPDPADAGDWGQDSRMNRSEAQRIAWLGLATVAPALVAGLDEQSEWVSPFFSRISIQDCRQMGLEVISIEEPSEATKKRYADAIANPVSVNGRAMRIDPDPVGILRCRQWQPVSFGTYDLPTGVKLRGHGKQAKDDRGTEYLLPMEKSRLDFIFPGIRLYGSVRVVIPEDDDTEGRSDGQLVFLDHCENVFPTFNTVLLNDLEITNLIQSDPLRRQTKEVVWHSTAEAFRWERNESRSLKFAAVNDEFDDDIEEDENEAQANPEPEQEKKKKKKKRRGGKGSGKKVLFATAEEQKQDAAKGGEDFDEM